MSQQWAYQTIIYKVLISHSSYDARDGGPENGQRWSDKERGFGNRARFRWRDGPAYLHIDRIHSIEAGLYRCRVDFKTAPTRNSLLNLTVVSKYIKHLTQI